MKYLTIRLPDELHELLRATAFKRKMSMNAITLEALTLRFEEDATFDFDKSTGK